jgi:hypothetical protein
MRGALGAGLASIGLVDCWIGVGQERNRRVVKLAGRLAAAQVPELLTACAGEGAVELELTDLVSADPAGIEAILRLQGQGVRLAGVPGYIRLKLEASAGGPAADAPPPKRTT